MIDNINFWEFFTHFSRNDVGTAASNAGSDPHIAFAESF